MERELPLPHRPSSEENSCDTLALRVSYPLRVRSDTLLLKDYISQLPMWTTDAIFVPARALHPIVCGDFGHQHTWVTKRLPYRG